MKLLFLYIFTNLNIKIFIIFTKKLVFAVTTQTRAYIQSSPRNRLARKFNSCLPFLMTSSLTIHKFHGSDTLSILASGPINSIEFRRQNMLSSSV